MGYKYAKRELFIPKEQWDMISRADFQPHQLLFMASMFSTNLKLTLKLDGAGSRHLAKSLAMFFFFDDYGKMVWDKVLQTMQIFELAEARLRFPSTKTWEKAQQDEFFAYCNTLAEYEGQLDEEYRNLHRP